MIEELVDLLQEERKLSAELETLEARWKAIRDIIKEEMVQRQIEKFESSGWAYSVISPKPGERFDRKGLVRAGVLPDLIDKAAIPVIRAAYLNVRKAGEHDAG